MDRNPEWGTGYLSLGELGTGMLATVNSQQGSFSTRAGNSTFTVFLGSFVGRGIWNRCKKFGNKTLGKTALKTKKN